jgi:hypothetical protein
MSMGYPWVARAVVSQVTSVFTQPQKRGDLARGDADRGGAGDAGVWTTPPLLHKGRTTATISTPEAAAGRSVFES